MKERGRKADGEERNIEEREQTDTESQRQTLKNMKERKIRVKCGKWKEI